MDGEQKRKGIAFGPPKPISHSVQKPKAVVELANYFSLSLSFSSLFLFLVAEERADHSLFAKGKHKHTDTKTGGDFSLYTFDAGRW